MMARFILDSDILSYLDDSSSPFHSMCLDRFSQCAEEELCISIMTVLEIDYRLAGCDKAQLPALQEFRKDIVNTFRLLPLSLSLSRRFGNLKAAFKFFSKAKSNTMKGHTVDIILAATALEYDAVMVSNDRIFLLLKEVEPALKIENWAR